MNTVNPIIAIQPAGRFAKALASLLLTAAASAACAGPSPHAAAAAAAPPAMPAPDKAIAAMPVALSNNAVAAAVVDGETRLYSFMGLGAGKTRTDISRAAFEYEVATSAWRRLPDVPVGEGRLASVAVAAAGAVYLFGGYAVAADGHETSTPDVLRFDPRSRSYRKVAPMPVPVDDAVALVRGDRWIYLISGWHQDRNVALVQVYDARKNRWRRATDYPGAPVFGHAGAILGDLLLICDGVRLDVIAGKRTFSASPECWRGNIAADAPMRIAWRRIESHPGPARYRMGAAADTQRGLMFFAGGSENPYNFNGIGYDGKPSPASDRVQAYDPANDRWLDDLMPLPEASMDHRGSLALGGRLYLIGGMRDGQRVSAETIEYSPELMDRPPPP